MYYSYCLSAVGFGSAKRFTMFKNSLAEVYVAESVMYRACGVVVFLSDVGRGGPYSATMYGVVAGLCPEARVMEITSEVPSFDKHRASVLLLLSYRYFPIGSVFVVVVFPGVGKSTRPLLLVTKRFYFIGPDNGVMTAAAEDDGIEAVYEIRRDALERNLSEFFHGRDIYAPIAARLACGDRIDALAKRIDKDALTRSDELLESKRIGNCIELKAMYIDSYGNTILSQRFNDLATELDLSLGSRVTVCNGMSPEELCVDAEVVESFSDTSIGTLILYRDSFGFAEIAINQGSARETLHVNEGSSIKICRKQ